MQWYIARHGESEDNNRGVWSGQRDGALTTAGREHAGKLGLYLRDKNPGLIISSDLRRAYDTAIIAADAANYNGEIRKDPRLREINWGDFEGRTIDDIRALSGMPDFQYYDTVQLTTPTRNQLAEQFNLEPLANIEERRDSLLKDIITYARQGMAALVTITHSAFTAYLLEGILHGTCGEHIKLREHNGYFPQRHFEITTLTIDQRDGTLAEKEINKAMYRP